MPAGWPVLGPMRETDPNADLTGGHPTAPGALDQDRNYPRLPNVEESPGNGRPGRPKYRALSDRHGKMGGRIPGPVPTGTVQPGVDYDEGSAV